MLEDYTNSDRVSYVSHHLLVAGDDPIEIGGALGAAILCAMLADTDEGKRRGIAIDTDTDRRAWIMHYEREVRCEEWGLIDTEVQLLSDAYIQLATGSLTWADICPNILWMDLAMRTVSTYMRHLTVEAFGGHIWEYIPWREPFGLWLLDAAKSETIRQRYIHTDWTDPVPVCALADTEINADKHEEALTFIFEGEDTQDIMERYYKWTWGAYQAQLRQIPGSQPRAAKHRTAVFNRETDWRYFNDERNRLSETDQQLFIQWIIEWEKFAKQHFKPEKSLEFWVKGVSEERQRQLVQFMRIQEKEWDYFIRVSASVYALRLLGYVRRTCSLTDITRWLTEQLVNDYTTKNNRDQFRRAWKEHGRYTEHVKYILTVLMEYGIDKFQPE